MPRFLTAAALALALCAPVAAYATEPLVAKLAEVDDMVKNAAPHFVCPDQTDPKTCDQFRLVLTDGGAYAAYDFADGHTVQCYARLLAPYRVCRDTRSAWAEVLDGDHWIVASSTDSRCAERGGPLTVGYLACEAIVLPSHRPKT